MRSYSPTVNQKLQPGLWGSHTHGHFAAAIAPCRCKVRAYEHASHTFYLLNQDGSLPSRQYVQMACQVGACWDKGLLPGWGV